MPNIDKRKEKAIYARLREINGYDGVAHKKMREADKIDDTMFSDVEIDLRCYGLCAVFVLRFALMRFQSLKSDRQFHTNFSDSFKDFVHATWIVSNPIEIDIET